MAVFRIERTRDYTVMSNHHLRKGKLSLKAKGLLSMMLSYRRTGTIPPEGLPPSAKRAWTLSAARCGSWKLPGTLSAISARPAGSDQRYRVCYLRATTAEEPGPPAGYGFTRYGKPGYGKTGYGKARRIKYREIKYRKNNYLWIKYRFYSLPGAAARQPPERKGRDAMSVSEMESYRDLILENIEYDHLCREFTTYREDLDEIVELMVETVCAKRENHPDRWQRLPP